MYLKSSNTYNKNRCIAYFKIAIKNLIKMAFYYKFMYM